MIVRDIIRQINGLEAKKTQLDKMIELYEKAGKVTKSMNQLVVDTDTVLSKIDDRLDYLYSIDVEVLHDNERNKKVVDL